MASSFNFKNNKKHHVVSDINITPFVDILLVLLIIFMVTAPMITSSVDVTLPEGSADKISDKIQPIPVSIKSNGSIFIEEDSVKISSLPEKLLAVSNNNLNRKVYVRADKNLDYGRVMKVVRLINNSGFNQVSLATELVQ